MEPTPSRGRAASMGALLSALTVGAVMFVAHNSAGGFSSASASRAGAVDFVALAGADDNDYPSEIDDTYHKGCPGFEDSSVFTSTSCDDTDDGFCHEVKNDWCNGTMCKVFNVSGCSTCDGQFGACVMDALNFLPKICNETGHGRRLSGSDAISQQRSAALAALQRKSEKVVAQKQDKLVEANFTEYPDCDICACAHPTSRAPPSPRITLSLAARRHRRILQEVCPWHLQHDHGGRSQRHGRRRFGTERLRPRMARRTSGARPPEPRHGVRCVRLGELMFSFVVVRRI